MQVESFNPDLPPDYSALRVGSSTDLVAMLRRAGGEYDEAVDLAIHGHLSEEATCARSLGSPMLRSAEAGRLRMRSVLEADVQALFDFSGTGEDIQALRDRYGFTTSQLTSPGAQAMVAYQALTNGVSRVVSFAAASNLDTHFDDWEDSQAPQPVRRVRGGGRPRATPRRGRSSRTAEVHARPHLHRLLQRVHAHPLLNARGGRDHWLCNSCAIVGGKSRRAAACSARRATWGWPAARRHHHRRGHRGRGPRPDPPPRARAPFAARRRGARGGPRGSARAPIPGLLST
ncbi:MAG: hypothetical protein R3B82_26725 [Sandaracinaceae bacterium]